MIYSKSDLVLERMQCARDGFAAACFIPTGFVMQFIESAETRIEFVSIGAVLYFASRKMTVFCL